MCIVGHSRDRLWGLVGLMAPEALWLVNSPSNLDSQAGCCHWCFMCYWGSAGPQNICALYQLLVMQVFMSKPFSVSHSPFKQKIPRKAEGQFLPLAFNINLNFRHLCTLSSVLGLSVLMLNGFCWFLRAWAEGLSQQFIWQLFHPFNNLLSDHIITVYRYMCVSILSLCPF